MKEATPQLKIHLIEGKTYYVDGKESIEEIIYNYTHYLKEDKLFVLRENKRNHTIYINPNHIIGMEEYETFNPHGLTFLK